MGLALISLPLLHFFSLLRIFLRYVLLKPGINEEDLQKKSKTIDQFCGWIAAIAIVVDSLVNFTLIGSNPISIAFFEDDQVSTYLLSCRPDDLTGFVYTFFLPKALIILLLLSLLLLISHKQHIFATNSLSTLPEAKEDTKLTLKFKSFYFM